MRLKIYDVAKSPENVQELITQFRDNLFAFLKQEESKTISLTPGENATLDKFKKKLLQDFATVQGFEQVWTDSIRDKSFISPRRVIR